MFSLTHIRSGMRFSYPGTIPSDMCSPTRDTHIANGMCFPDRGTHITRDMCSQVEEHIWLVMSVPLPGKHASLVICDIVIVVGKHIILVKCVPLPSRSHLYATV